MYTVYRFFLFLIAFLCLTFTAKAQYEEKDFVRYSVKEGISDNYITCLEQDDRGYIWAGTNVGLNRFDGHTFKNFYRGNAALPLSSGDIRYLKKTGYHLLSIIGGGGLQIVNTKDFSIKNYLIPDTTAFNSKSNAAWDAVRLPDHSYAVTTASGFYVVGSSGRLLYRHDAYSQADIGKKTILYGREIFQLNDKEILVYSERKDLSLYNADKKIFRQIDSSETQWKNFFPPANDHWVVKYQLQPTQFIFIPYRMNSIVWYDHLTGRQVLSPLPFQPGLKFGWESKIEMINDTLFSINAVEYGFYLFHIDRKTGRITGDDHLYLSSFKVTCLLTDKDKRLWAGTSEGLLRQTTNPSIISSFRYPPSFTNTLAGTFSAAFQYKDKLYAGRTSFNNGLVIVDPVSMAIQKQVNFFGGNNPWNEVISIQSYHPDTLWLGTTMGLLWFDTRSQRYGKVLDTIKHPWASDIAPILAPQNRDGYAWFCSYLGGLVIRYHVDTRTFRIFTSGTIPALPFDKVKSVAYDSYGDVWIGGHSLTRWNSRKEQFDTLIKVYGGAGKFNDNILTLTADNNGSLWLHNVANGLLEYRIKEKIFVSITMKDGLPSDVLQAFSPVIDGKLWIGSNSHLTRFDTRTKKMTVFDQYDGLPGNKPSTRRIFYDSATRHLYMCSGEFIVRVDTKLSPVFKTGSELMVQELSVNNDRSVFEPRGKNSFKYHENNILLHFTVIDFEKNNYQFSYKLNDAEDWNDLAQQRSLHLTNLQPGNYSVWLKATGKDGDEKSASYHFKIMPPFWRTNWFLIAITILISGTLYYLYRRRIKEVKQKANIDKLLAQTEMKALHSQMNPHFIFNSLNSIKEMILNKENREASHYLSKFAQLIRITLDQSGQAFISLRNTIDYLKQYIEMEKIRNNRFTYEINVDYRLEMDDIFLPPMLIQPFIENAIWHGAPANNNILIRIDFEKGEGRLVCKIDDNGIGIDQSMKSKGNHRLHAPVGISNIRNRIRLLNEKYDMKSSIIILDKKDSDASQSGTLVTLYLPLEINAEWLK